MTVLAERGIVETFMRFDNDGDGFMDRRELMIVLRHVEPGMWTEQEINRLLDTADVNGDGKIHVEDFVQWIFRGADPEDCPFTKKRVSMQLRDVEFVAPSAVRSPPDGEDDVEFVRYALAEHAEGWYVRITHFDAPSGQAFLTNGASVLCPPSEAAKLEELLRSVCDGVVVSGLLEKRKSISFDRQKVELSMSSPVVVIDLEHVAPQAVAMPPKSLGDPNLLKYLSEEDREGWYVAIVQYDHIAKKALLTNGVRVGVPEDQVEYLSSLLSVVPEGAVVSGLLHVDASAVAA